jgi:CDP-paratose 2-epimerase
MRILITGGAGFIGTNAALHFLKNKEKVTLLDNFSRKGTKINAAYIKKKFPVVDILTEDIRNFSALQKVVRKHDVVIHLAGQVAVTTSILNPREDFEINALGTFNVLEAARLAKHKPIVLYSSTNKVYGEFPSKIVKKGKRYMDVLHKNGIDEGEGLDFHSPYGCSKGVGDQYVRDYSRLYDLPTVVFRQSCIYGVHQFGVEDQGWVAHFIIKVLKKKPITVFGNGMQVRDILYVDDLINAYERAINKISKANGEIFNVGGGVENSLSLLELLDKLEKRTGKTIAVTFAEKRPGDQDIYISNNTKIKKILGWKPSVPVEDGLEKLFTWLEESIDTI